MEDLYTFKRRAFVRQPGTSRTSKGKKEEELKDEDEEFEDVLEYQDTIASTEGKRKRKGRTKHRKELREAMAAAVEVEEEDDEVEALAPVMVVEDDVSDAEEVVDVEAEFDDQTQKRIKLLEEARATREQLAEAEMEDLGLDDEPEVVGTAHDPPEPKGVGPKLRINVRCAGEEKVGFDICVNEKLATLFQLFAEERGVESSACTFGFDGQRIDGSRTPRQLDMEDQDLVEATAPPRRRKQPCLDDAPPPPGRDERRARDSEPCAKKKRDKVVLVVTRRGGREKPLRVKIHADDKFDKLIQHYAKIKKIPAGHLALKYDGQPVKPQDTPADYGIVESATLAAVY